MIVQSCHTITHFLTIWTALCLFMHQAFADPSNWMTIAMQQNYTTNVTSNLNMTTESPLDFSCSSNCAPHEVARSYQCDYVKYCCNGTITDGKFDYLHFEYCTMSNYKTFGALILSIVLIYSFLFIGNICDNYFAQTTGAMADLMGISHNVAGVTFLALGNGANDISAAYAGLKNGGNQTLLILGDLLGGATFNPIVISALIAIACRSNAPKMDKIAFVRDCTFICIAVGYTFYFTSKGSITLFESIVLWVIYLMYVAVVIFGEVYKKWKQKENNRTVINIGINVNAGDGDDDDDDDDLQNKDEEVIDDGTDEAMTRKRTLDELGAGDGGDPADSEFEEESFADKLKRKPIYYRVIYYIIRFPIFMLDTGYLLTLPRIDKKHWKLYGKLAPVWCITAPLFTMFAYGFITAKVGSVPIVIFVAVFCCILGVAVGYYARTSATNANDEQKNESLLINDGSGDDEKQENRKKKGDEAFWKPLFLVLAFVCGTGWIILIATEIVNLLTVVGIISTIDLDIIGLTVLAWGNNIGDVSISKRGYPKAGIGACIIGPSLQLLLGMGLGFTVATLSSDTYEVKVSSDNNITLSCFAIIFGMIVYVGIVYLSKWRLTKWLGVWNLAYYSLFLILTILVFFKVIA